MHTADATRIVSPLFLWGAGGIATLIGLSGVLLTDWNMQQDRASESWPEAIEEFQKNDGGFTTHVPKPEIQQAQ